MATEILVLEGKGIEMKIHLNKGLLEDAEIYFVREDKKMRERITFELYQASALDKSEVYESLVIEHVYERIEDNSKVFSEEYQIKDYTRSIATIFNENIGTKYRDKASSRTISLKEAKEYVEKLLDYIDAIHTQRKFHELLEVLKESLKYVNNFYILSLDAE